MRMLRGNLGPDVLIRVLMFMFVLMHVAMRMLMRMHHIAVRMLMAVFVGMGMRVNVPV